MSLLVEVVSGTVVEVVVDSVVVVSGPVAGCSPPEERPAPPATIVVRATRRALVDAVLTPSHPALLEPLSLMFVPTVPCRGVGECR
jgi:hypothetical protein